MSNYEKKYKEALDKAKRYDEALERASNLHKDAVEMENNMTTKTCEIIFPELKESEDERIRKALITAVSGTFKGNTLWHTDVTREEALAWLEKQKEFVSADFDDVWETADCEELTAPLEKYSKDAIKKMCHAWYDKGIELERRNWLEKQGVQPRYNIGDIICDKSCTTLNKEAQPNMEIVDIKNGMYICDKGSFPVSQQDEYELVSKKIDTKLNDDSVSNELRAASVKHAEKELKNHTFPNNEEFELVYTFEEGAKWKAAQKPTAWSEEDEGIFDDIIDFLENGTVKLQHDLSLYASWLKSIKDRVGCEVNCTTTKEWSEEDEYRTEKLLGWLNTLVNYIQGDATVSLDLYRERERQIEIIKTWLKSLKALNTWKPSDEQIKALKNFTRSVVERGYFSPYDDNTKLLYSLLEDLKKLK